MTMPGLSEHPGAPLAPGDCLGLDAKVVGALRHDVGDHRVRNGVALQKRQVEQFVGGCEGQRLVLLGRQLRHHVAGHAGDDETRPARRDHAAELLEHHGRTIQVDRKHAIGGCHVGRQAGRFGSEGWHRGQRDSCSRRRAMEAGNVGQRWGERGRSLGGVQRGPGPSAGGRQALSACGSF